MKFCSNCNNMLIPRNGVLICRICNQEYELQNPDKTEYKLVKKIAYDISKCEPIIVKTETKKGRISLQDRKAYEDYFTTFEQFGY